MGTNPYKILEGEVDEFFDGMQPDEAAYGIMFFLSDYPKKMRGLIAYGKATEAMHLAWEAKHIYILARRKLYGQKGHDAVKSDMRDGLKIIWSKTKPMLALAGIAAENPSCYKTLAGLIVKSAPVLDAYKRKIKRLNGRHSDVHIDTILESLRNEEESLARRSNEIIIRSVERHFLRERGYGTGQIVEQ